MNYRHARVSVISMVLPAKSNLPKSRVSEKRLCEYVLPYTVYCLHCNRIYAVPGCITCDSEQFMI